ncbi:DUF6090 family protein [Aegicerativicinus sediminis]|uniref:DUF6090 family protein n=1 Tax=Aegicerativicinus sediminis TaxID=2893202 RepID=UPI001E606B9F|nr:DUF6090 family protein [Aegicerativicinus sediminis]
MISIFRKLRKDLIESNKTKRYIKYGIGEILLVVIGILIALQVNNWNENRKSEKRKTALLYALKSEFELNLVQLDSVLLYDKKVIESSYKALKLQPTDPLLQNRDSMRWLIQNTSWIWTFDPQNGALRSGMSSGDINLIENDTLVNMLFSWQDLVADAKENEDRTLMTRLEAKPVIGAYVRNVDYRGTESKILGESKFESDYIGLINDPLFEDYISDRLTRTSEAVKELGMVRKYNLQIIKMVDEELRSGN